MTSLHREASICFAEVAVVADLIEKKMRKKVKKAENQMMKNDRKNIKVKMEMKSRRK